MQEHDPPQARKALLRQAAAPPGSSLRQSLAAFAATNTGYTQAPNPPAAARVMLHVTPARSVSAWVAPLHGSVANANATDLLGSLRRAGGAAAVSNLVV